MESGDGLARARAVVPAIFSPPPQSKTRPLSLYRMAAWIAARPFATLAAASAVFALVLLALVAGGMHVDLWALADTDADTDGDAAMVAARPRPPPAAPIAVARPCDANATARFGDVVVDAAGQVCMATTGAAAAPLNCTARCTIRPAAPHYRCCDGAAACTACCARDHGAAIFAYCASTCNATAPHHCARTRRAAAPHARLAAFTSRPRGAA